LVKVGTGAAALGGLAGLWDVYGTYSGGFGSQCVPTATICGLTEFGSTSFLVLGALLVLVSLISIVGPRKVFYGSAAISVAIAILVAITTPVTETTALISLALGASTLVLSLVAARRETKVSEQSNPMNLPVFG
jgi:hypothetical protein